MIQKEDVSISATNRTYYKNSDIDNHINIDIISDIDNDNKSDNSNNIS